MVESLSVLVFMTFIENKLLTISLLLSGMARILRFEELICWQEARELTKRIYRLTQDSPINTNDYLKDQMRRSAISIVSNIAEGKERETASEFVRFLFVAKGSAGELQAQLTMTWGDSSYRPREAA